VRVVVERPAAPLERPPAHAAATPPAAGPNERANPFAPPHTKEWATLGPYDRQIKAAKKVEEAMAKKQGLKSGKPKLFARSTDLSRDRRAQRRAAGKRSSKVGLREPELRSVLSGGGNDELFEATLSKYSVVDHDAGNDAMDQWWSESLVSRGSQMSRGSVRSQATARTSATAPSRPW
jgi:hypothetical protein